MLVRTYNVSESDIIREPKFFARPNQFSIARMEFEEHLVSEEFLGEKSPPQICTLADIFLCNGMLLESPQKIPTPSLISTKVMSRML